MSKLEFEKKFYINKYAGTYEEIYYNDQYSYALRNLDNEDSPDICFPEHSYVVDTEEGAKVIVAEILEKRAKAASLKNQLYENINKADQKFFADLQGQGYIIRRPISMENKVVITVEVP